MSADMVHRTPAFPRAVRTWRAGWLASLNIAACACVCLCAGQGASLHGQTTAGGAQAQAQTKTKAASGPAPKVTVSLPTRVHLKRVSVQPGQVLPIASAPLFARVAGYISEVRVDIGDKVVKDQPLLMIDAPELVAESARKQAAVVAAEANRNQAKSAIQVAQAGVVSAQAKIAEARAAIRVSNANTEFARSEAARAGQLARSGAVTASVDEEAQSKLASSLAAQDVATAQAKSAEAALSENHAKLDKSKADLAAAEAALSSAGKDLEIAQIQAGFTEIKAPFDGIVIQRGVDPGHLAMAGHGPTPLLTVVRSDKVTVAVGIPEAEAVFAEPGDIAEIQFEALVGKAVRAKIDRAAWALDPSTRTLLAEIDLPNSDGALRPGLFARASIIVGDRPNALTIPKSAVIRQNDTMICFTVEKRIARARQIRIGLSDDKRVEILSGLDDQERVIDNPDSVIDGQIVDISENSTSSSGS